MGALLAVSRYDGAIAMTPGEFCITYFQELDRLGIPYVMLHSREMPAKGLTSDVDYAVPTSELGRLAGIQARLAEGASWHLAQAIEPHIYSLYTVVVDPEDARAFVQLDACGHYVETGCFLLPDTALLEGRARDGEFFAPAPAVEFAYLLAKGLAKGGRLGPRLPRLRELWQRTPAECEARLQRLVGPVPGGLEAWFQKPAAEWEALRPRLMKRNRFGLADQLRELARAWRRVIEPEGLHLAWVDATGQGGASLKELVAARFQGSFFRRRRTLGLEGALSPAEEDRGVDSTAGPPSRAGQPGAEPVGRPRIGIARRWWGVFVARVRDELVISEGRVDDLPLGPRRWAWWLWWLRPRADLTILVVGDPEQLHAQRPEVPLEALRRQQDQFRALLRGRRGYTLVLSGPSVEATGQAVCREVIRFLVERERGRSR